MPFGLLQFLESFVVDVSDESLAARLQLCIVSLEAYLLSIVAAVESVINAVDIKVLRVKDCAAEEHLPLVQLKLRSQFLGELANFVLESLPLLVRLESVHEVELLPVVLESLRVNVEVLKRLVDCVECLFRLLLVRQLQAALEIRT